MFFSPSVSIGKCSWKLCFCWQNFCVFLQKVLQLLLHARALKYSFFMQKLCKRMHLNKFFSHVSLLQKYFDPLKNFTLIYTNTKTCKCFMRVHILYNVSSHLSCTKSISFPWKILHVLEKPFMLFYKSNTIPGKLCIRSQKHCTIVFWIPLHTKCLRTKKYWNTFAVHYHDTLRTL